MDSRKIKEKKLSKMGMGQVLSQYLNHINPSNENNQETPNHEIDSFHFSYEIDFNLSEEQFEKKRKFTFRYFKRKK